MLARKLLLPIVFILCNFIALGQTYNFKNYNVEDGLAQSQVFSLFQDAKGYMWFGTNGGGISKYDGIKFKNYTTKDGLIGNYVYSITQNKKGELFFATYDGLSVYNGLTFKNYTSKDGLPENAVYSIYIDRNEKIWIGTNKGICNLVNGKIIPFNPNEILSGKAVFTIFEDAAGNMWFGTLKDGAIKFNPETKKTIVFSKENGFFSYENFIRSINEDHKGNVILGSVAGSVFVSPQDKKIEVNISRQDNVGFTGIFKDNQNALWLCSENGIYKYANNKLANHFKTHKGLIGDGVLCGMQDKEGNYWFGTNGFGITKLTNEMFTNYSAANGLPEDYVNCSLQDSKGNVWIGSGRSGAVMIGDGEFKRFHVGAKEKNQRIIDKTVQAISEDKFGAIWFATQTGISVFDGLNIKDYVGKNGLPDTNIYSLLKDKEGVMWVGTNDGLCYFDGTKFIPIPEILDKKGTEDVPIYNVFQDKQGAYWLATNVGITKYHNKKITHFNASTNFKNIPVYSTVQDSKGNYWFSSESGVYHFDGTTFKNINDTMGLSYNQVWLIQLDDKNNLWIGTNSGLDRLNLNEYYQTGKIVTKHYGKEEGLKGLECNMNAAAHGNDGNIWFGTIKGVTIYNPRFDKTNYQETRTHLTGLRLFFEPADFTDYSSSIDTLSGLPNELVLPYDKNHVTFDFVGICHANSTKVLYSFKLEGADDNWSPPVSRLEVTYSSLQPGDYTFLLKSMNNDGIWNETPTTFKFTILPPWYRTWWFYGMCVVIVIASIYAYNTYKTAKLRQNNIKLEETVVLRTKELRDEKEKVELINKEVLEQKSIIEHKNHEITDSIKYAKDIQTALLPAQAILKKDLPESFVLYMPKDIVSGDFYWFAKRDGKNYFASCDCTGHGVPGAFMSIIGNSLLTEIVAEQNVFEPANILNHLDSGVKAALNQNKGEFERRDGMDIALCAFNKKTMTIEYAGANRPLWIFRKDCEGVCEIVKPDKFAIGGIDLEQKHPFTPHEIKVKEGDSLYVFSDGYADQFGGERGKKMMVGNLQKLLGQIYTKPMDEQREILLKNFNDWKGDHEQIDDILIIGVKVQA